MPVCVRKHNEKEKSKMAKFKTAEEMAKEVAEKALDEIKIEGKTLREWIDEVLEYYDKKQEGKLIELPCKPGDTVYLLVTDIVGLSYISPHKVKNIIFCVEIIPKVGKTVFLTKQEARKALEKMKKENE